jgi:hypothetical protein
MEYDGNEENWSEFIYQQRQKMKNEKFSTAHSRRVQEDRWINYKQKRSTTSWQNI